MTPKKLRLLNKQIETLSNVSLTRTQQSTIDYAYETVLSLQRQSHRIQWHVIKMLSIMGFNLAITKLDQDIGENMGLALYLVVLIYMCNVAWTMDRNKIAYDTARKNVQQVEQELKNNQYT